MTAAHGRRLLRIDSEALRTAQTTHVVIVPRCTAAARQTDRDLGHSERRRATDGPVSNSTPTAT